MHGHFKILLIQVRNMDEKKLFMEQFEEAFVALDRKKMWAHVGALVKYNREQIDAVQRHLPSYLPPVDPTHLPLQAP
jgi:hypothetical protein